MNKNDKKRVEQVLELTRNTDLSMQEIAKRVRVGSGFVMNAWNHDEGKEAMAFRVKRQKGLEEQPAKVEKMKVSVEVPVKKERKEEVSAPAEKKMKSSGDVWTKEELKLLKNTAISAPDLEKMLPGRTAEAIRGKRRDLGIRTQWTKEEEDLVKNLSLSDRECAKIINRSPASVSWKRRMIFGKSDSKKVKEMKTMEENMLLAPKEQEDTLLALNEQEEKDIAKEPATSVHSPVSIEEVRSTMAKVEELIRGYDNVKADETLLHNTEDLLARRNELLKSLIKADSNFFTTISMMSGISLKEAQENYLKKVGFTDDEVKFFLAD